VPHFWLTQRDNHITSYCNHLKIANSVYTSSVKYDIILKYILYAAEEKSNKKAKEAQHLNIFAVDIWGIPVRIPIIGGEI